MASSVVTIINHTEQDMHLEVPVLGASGEQKRERSIVDPDGKPVVVGAPINNLLRLGPRGNATDGGYSPQQTIERDDWDRLLKGKGNRDLLKDLVKDGAISIHGASL